MEAKLNLTELLFLKVYCVSNFQAQDRITKLYSVYCKFLLSFETLSEEEKQKIEQGVETDRQKLEKQRAHCATEKCIEKVQ